LEHGAEILASLANRPEEIAETATMLLKLAQQETSALACGLYRAVQDTGLLVPVGRIALTEGVSAERIAALMARAADQATTLLLSPARPATTGAVYRRRTTAPGGFVLWATVILMPPSVADEGQTESSAPGSAPVHGIGSSSPFHPQLLGVWVSVTRSQNMITDGSARSESASGAPQRLAESSRRVHPLFQLLLQQVVLRDTAIASRRQTGKRLREVTAIYDIGRVIDQVDIDDLFHLITQKASDVMEAQACSLLLMNEATNRLVIAASCGLPEDVVDNTSILIGQGIAGRVAQTGEALLVQSDARLDARFGGSRVVGLPGISSSITVPMFNEQRDVKGVLCIRRRTPSPPFSEDDKRLFSIFATQAGLAIKNARLYKELRSRVAELSTLASLTETISSTLDLDLVLSKVADSLIELVGFDRCVLYLKEDAEGASEERLTVRVARGFDCPIDELPPSHQLMSEVSSRLIPILVEEGDDSLALAVDYAETMGLRTFFAQPVTVRGNAIGALVVSNDITHRPMAYANLDLLSMFLQHAGIAIDNARLYAQMERRVRELHALYTMSRSLTMTYGLSRACGTVARVAREMVAADGVLLMLFNDRLDALRIREAQGLPPEVSDMLRFLPDANEILPEARALREPMHHASADNAAFESLFGARWSGMMAQIARIYPSLLLVPLIMEDTAVGYLLLGRESSIGFRSQETKLVSIISSQAGALLRSAALYEQSVEQRVLELSALYELSKKVRTARSLSAALDAILDIVTSVVWCDIAEIYTVDTDRRTMRRRVWRGEVSPDGEIHRDERSIPAWVVEERKALLIADVANDERFSEYQQGDLSCKSLMAIPIFLGDEVLGVLQVQAAVSGVYNQDNVKMLSLIATQAAALFRDMESLRELTTYTDNILRSIAAGVVTLDAKGAIVTLNLAAERIIRAKFSDLSGQPLETLLTRFNGESSDIEDIRKMVAHAVETRQIVQRHRLRIFSENAGEGAESVIVNGSASQLLSERGEYLGVVLVFEDITKEDEMEQELDRIGRLAEIGQLAAGIAHELRNPLASIKGAAQVLLGDLAPEMIDRHGEFLDIIVREVDGLNAVTSEFLEFSRPAAPIIEKVCVNTLLQRRIEFMRGEFDRLGVYVTDCFDQSLPLIEADANQLERMFLNIVLNAAQAMPSGGRINVSTAYLGTARDGVPGGRDSSGMVEIRIIDNGHGIPETRMERIFTPFFTTKTKGTGLGLSIVQKMVDSHGGHIHVDSKVDVGTTFTITLPVSSPFTQHFKLQSMSSTEIAEQRLHAAIHRPVQALLSATDQAPPQA
jgi:two-component system nitrogen regulation sensor histidine kinase GlnL